MKKYILQFILTLSIFSLILLIFIPYFTTDFLDLRQKKEKEENHQRLLKEEEALKQAKKDAKEKIYLLGKFDPIKREDFVLIPAKHTLGGNKMYLRKETYAAFLRMKESALLEKIDLQIVSATRNFDYQKILWNNKWTGVTFVDGKDLSKSIPDGLGRFKKILEYSSVPGISRHHWGTEIDINDANPEYFETQKGKEVYEWLTQNAPLFGFCQPYNSKEDSKRTGFNEEKWHWSYLPLAKDFSKRYKELIKDTDINGFLGEEYVPSLNLINDYIFSINPACL